MRDDRGVGAAVVRVKAFIAFVIEESPTFDVAALFRPVLAVAARISIRDAMRGTPFLAIGARPRHDP